MMKRYAFLLLMLYVQMADAREYKEMIPGKNALSFIENKGQIKDQQGKPRSDIDFTMQSGRMTLYIGKGKLHYQFAQPETYDTLTTSGLNGSRQYRVRGNTTIQRLDISLEGTSAGAVVDRGVPLNQQLNYYTGGASGGVTGVRAYEKITYKNIYPSIDWVLYVNDNQLKYDFVVHPGGRVSDIRMQYEGAHSLELGNKGELVVNTALASLTEQAPYSYEAGSRKEVRSRYVLNGRRLGFETDPYQGSLVIDPAVEWATYFGGALDDGGQSMAIDNAGFIYITGKTYSPSRIATTGAYQTTLSAGENDAYLAKFDSLGKLQWATYYGGSSNGFILPGAEWYSVVSCDRFGHVYLAGSTVSENGIATPGSFQETLNDNSFLPFNGFVARFNNDGTLKWGTYYGASTTNTKFWAIATDGEGSVYVAGDADSSTSTTNALVTNGAFQTRYGGGTQDGILVKFDSSGKRQWATYYGSASSDVIEALICDDSNNVYIAGYGFDNTPSLVTPGTLDDAFYNGAGGILARFNSKGVRQWGSYMHFYANALAIDNSGHVYVGGYNQNSISDSFIVTPGCHQPYTINSNHTDFNGVLLQMNRSNGTRNWGTYYGSDGATFGRSIACDHRGNVYFAGNTNAYGSSTFTIAMEGVHQDTLNAAPNLPTRPDDAFVVQFDSSGTRKWATYYGGIESDGANAVAVDRSGALYLLGTTNSTKNVTTPGSYQQNNAGDADAFLVRFSPFDMSIKGLIEPENDTICLGPTPLTIVARHDGRIDRKDVLWVNYTYTGPDNGSDSASFTQVFTPGMTDTLNVGTVDFRTPGTYNLTIYLQYSRDDEERNNDTLHFSFYVSNTLPVADINVNQVGTTFFFSNKNAQPSDHYFWDFGDGNTSTEAAPSHEYKITDTYEVRLIVTNFCGSDTTTIQIAGIGKGNGIKEAGEDYGIAIYPNPAQQILFVTSANTRELIEYRIVDLMGKTLLKGSLRKSLGISLSNIVPGSYFIRVRTDKGWFTKPFQLVKY